MIREKVNFTFSLEKSLGWDSKHDYSPLHITASIYTEGWLSFFHEGLEQQKCLYLLEFFVGTKTHLLRHFGGKHYEAKVAMPYSGGGYHIAREDDLMTMKFNGETVLTANYEVFVSDFLIFEERLKAAMKEHFPLMSSSREFELLF